VELVRLNELPLSYFMDETGQLKLGGVALDERRVAQMIAMIRTAGPFVSVVIDEDERVVAGHHVLKALSKLEHEQVPVVQVELTSGERRRARNCVRSFGFVPTKLDQCEAAARHEASFDDIDKADPKQGRPPSGEDPPSRFTVADRAAEFGLSERTYQRRLRIVRNIDDGVRDNIRHLEIADNQRQLEHLARMTTGEQEDVADILAADEAADVEEALCLLESSSSEDA
jgi:hypothetical protein